MHFDWIGGISIYVQNHVYMQENVGLNVCRNPTHFERSQPVQLKMQFCNIHLLYVRDNHRFVVIWIYILQSNKQL